MRDCRKLADKLLTVYEAIYHEQMEGLPLINPLLSVECLHFQQLENGRCIGVLVTPWLMSLVLFPAEGENWDELEVGHKQMHEFPSGRHPFLVNEVAGLGVFQAKSLYSPVKNFALQDHARAEARTTMQRLMTPLDPETHLDEQRLECFINGEDLADIGCGKEDTAEVLAQARKENTPQSFSRRDLLFGRRGDKKATA
jgi:[NiFe] hydrogenase assembly HybE family chaperone